jgi:hypothetical protein
LPNMSTFPKSLPQLLRNIGCVRSMGVSGSATFCGTIFAPPLLVVIDNMRVSSLWRSATSYRLIPRRMLPGETRSLDSPLQAEEGAGNALAHIAKVLKPPFELA